MTWTFGLRDTFNSNPLNPHDQVARLRGSFNSISHDVNQPLNAAIQTHLGNLFSSTPLAILQPRTAIAWQFEPKYRTPHRLRDFQRHPAGQRGRPDRYQSAVRSRRFREDCLRGHRICGCDRSADHRAGSAEQRGRRNRCRESDFYFGISRRASSRAHLRRQIRRVVFPRSRSRPSQMANCTRRTSWSGAWEWNISSERRPAYRHNTSARAL